MLLPAEDAYDRELVFEEAEYAARHHGAAGLRVGQIELRVAYSTAKLGAPCASCGAPVRVVSYVVGGRRICTQCAKNAVSLEL